MQILKIHKFILNKHGVSANAMQCNFNYRLFESTTNFMFQMRPSSSRSKRNSDFNTNPEGEESKNYLVNEK